MDSLYTSWLLLRSDGPFHKTRIVETVCSVRICAKNNRRTLAALMVGICRYGEGQKLSLPENHYHYLTVYLFIFVYLSYLILPICSIYHQYMEDLIDQLKHSGYEIHAGPPSLS